LGSALTRGREPQVAATGSEQGHRAQVSEREENGMFIECSWAFTITWRGTCANRKTSQTIVIRVIIFYATNKSRFIFHKLNQCKCSCH